MDSLTAGIAKRCLDLLCVLALLPVALPLALVIAVGVRLSSRGPVLYGQNRIGRNGRTFRMWKFRTMHHESDHLLEKHFEDNPEEKTFWNNERKLLDDPRITRFGNLLRRASLDELPQIWHILIGDMSFVGPRPVVMGEVDKYGEHFELYKAVRPGLTGLWQVSGRNDLPFSERVELDALYVRTWSLWLDIKIILVTPRAVLLGDGAY